MAAFVARAIRAAAPGSLSDDPPNAFLDDDDSVHHEDINQLAEAGIVAGTGDGKYSPHIGVSRGQMARFLANAAEHVLGEPLPSDDDDFRDDDGDLFERDINQIAQAGITAGMPSRHDPPSPVPTFLSHYSVERAQAASFLARLLDLLVEEGAATPPS
jgi:hypothetical protein